MLACSVLFSAAGRAAAEVSGPLMPAALPDPWYAAPADVDSHQPGDVLASRGKPPPLGVLAASVTQLQFRSTDSAGRPIAAVATVLTPAAHQPDGPVLVWDHPTNALGLRCAPSEAMWSPDPDVTMRETVALDPVLAMGWTVILPDHLGPRSAYGAARLGGQITLDAARAATRFAPLAVQHSPIGLAGYSGGGMSAAFAAAMAPRYAPELHLVGAALGGVPADLGVMADALWHNAHPAFGLAAAVAFGLEREYPEALPIDRYLSPAGHAFRDQLNDACVNQILRLGFGHSVDDFASDFSLFFQPRTREVLADNSIDAYDGAPRMPVYEWHSPIDALLPLPQLDATMARWRTQGTAVTQVPVAAPDHLSAAVLGLPGAIGWLSERFTQEPR
ncbi:lipase [Nocardia terpenica]|uniref:Lipase n=1 Tax=Nocardia terpenica TaxID=455432 RepID=A0A6G9ZGL1_9NOCA|nr:lipase [Nocardia terpenica]